MAAFTLNECEKYSGSTAWKWFIIKRNWWYSNADDPTHCHTERYSWKDTILIHLYFSLSRKGISGFPEIGNLSFGFGSGTDSETRLTISSISSEKKKTESATAICLIISLHYILEWELYTVTKWNSAGVCLRVAWRYFECSNQFEQCADTWRKPQLKTSHMKFIT